MRAWFRRRWRLFLAFFRLDMDAVCEMSAGRGLHDGFHDYPDDIHQEPWHFTEMTCVRCKKKFYL
jgi:hypothetical protein